MATALSQINRTKINEDSGANGRVKIKRHELERELVLLCARTKLTPEQINRASFILSLSLDWRYLLGICYRNGVLPLVCKNLLEKFVYSLPPEVNEQLGDYYRQHAQSNIMSAGNLFKIVKMLEDTGIPSLPFKGPTLAMLAYGDLSLRQYVDLDILVQPKDFDRAVEIFLENGYRPHGSGQTKPGSGFIDRKKDIGLLNDDGVRVELHWKLSGSFFALPLELNRLWERLHKTNMGGREINSLSFEDLFVYLCLHGARHGFERLVWICDLCELIGTTKDIDWRSVRRHARDHGCEKVVEFGLYLAYDFFAVKIGYPEWRRIKKDEIYKKAAVRIRRKLFGIDNSTTEIGDWYLYHLMLKERKHDRLKLHLHYHFWYFKLALKPNAADRSIFHLPWLFYPLYYLLRPARLIFNYLTKTSQKK